MISVLSQPLSPALTGNPMVITIGCTDENGDTLKWRGIYAKLIKPAYLPLQAFEFFTIEYTEPSGLEVSLLFNTSPNPDESISAVPDDSVSFPSVQSYWTAVAEKVQAHPFINSRLKVFAKDTGSGMALVAEAADLNPEWVVNIDPGNTQDTSVENVVTPTSTVPDSYRVHIDVFIEEENDTGLFTLIGTLDDTPNSESQVRFDISGLLHAYIEDLLPDLKVPAWDAAAPQILETKYTYYLRIYELTPVFEFGFRDIVATESASAILGGISQKVFADNPDFLGVLDETNCILSWKDTVRTIDEQQPEWLPYFNTSESPARVGLHVMEYGENGVQLNDAIYFAPAILGSGEEYEVGGKEVILMPVSVRQLNISAAAYYYLVEIITADGLPLRPVSPMFTIYIDREYREEIRYLQYLNGFFAPELQRCTGDFNKALDVKSGDAERTLAPGFSSTVATRFSYQSDWNNRLRYHTGYLSFQEMEQLQELLIYRKVYEVSAEGYIPLLLLNKAMDVNSTGRNLRSIIIEAEPSQQYNYYSNIQLPQVETYWEEDDGELWLTETGVPWQEA